MTGIVLVAILVPVWLLVIGWAFRQERRAARLHHHLMIVTDEELRARGRYRR